MKHQDLYSRKLSNPGCSIAILYNPSISNTDFHSPSQPIPIVVISDQEGKMIFMEATNGKVIEELQMDCKSEIWSLISSFIDINTYTLYAGYATGKIYAFRVKIAIAESKSVQLQIIKLWEQKAEDMITKLEYLDINNDGKKELIASSLDHSLRVLDGETGKLVWGQLFQAGITTFKSADLHGNGIDTVISAASDGSLRLFKVSNGELIKFSTLANNVRTIDVIKTPNHIGETPIYSKSPSIIICGCDDYCLYLLDGVTLAILVSFTMSSYIWHSGCILPKSNTSSGILYISTYSFNFMEGVVIPNENDQSLLRFYNTQNFTKIDEISNINIQTITAPFIKGDNLWMVAGTTDKKVHIIDVNTKKIIFSIDADDIVNAVQICTFQGKLLVFYCDDKNNFRAFEID